MWKSVSPLYRDRGCILRSGAKRRRHVTPVCPREAPTCRQGAAAAGLGPPRPEGGQQRSLGTYEAAEHALFGLGR